MRKLARTLLLLSLVALVAPLVAPSVAQAQYREFSGKVDKINKKKMIVDNRKGDKVTFDRVDDGTVEGEGKASWEDVKKNDWVSVSWKMMDKPRKAYKIKVIPTPKEAGEDE